MGLQASYDELIRRSREVALLGSCSALLGWDEQTYMPRGGIEHRGGRRALWRGLPHERATDQGIGSLRGGRGDSARAKDAVPPPGVTAREIRRSYRRLTRLPRSLVEEMARTTSIAQQE